MTDFPVIVADTRERIYVATAGQKDFDVPFTFQRAADLQFAVEETADEEDWLSLDYGADFTVTGTGAAAGGALSLFIGAIAGVRYRVRGLAAIDRLTSVVAGGKFDAAALDAEIARQRIIAQEMRRDIDAVPEIAVANALSDTLAARQDALAAQAAAEDAAAEATAAPATELATVLRGQVFG